MEYRYNRYGTILANISPAGGAHPEPGVHGVRQCTNFDFGPIYATRLTVHIHTTQRPKYSADTFLNTPTSFTLNPAGSM